MAKNDRINLIKEFSEEQKDNDYILLTTFCFDPIFFDNFLLQKIRVNNPLAEIVILIDAGQYDLAQSRFSNQTGRKYHLIPIYLERGVFHPKIFTFISAREKRATCYTGSSNLTHAGFTRNAELILKTEYSEENLDENIHHIKEFYESLMQGGFIQEKSAIGIIQRAFDWIPEEYTSNPNFRLIHNVDNAILPQMKDEIKENSFKELFLFAPHFSPNHKVISELNSAFEIETVGIGIQSNNHNLTPEPYIDYFSKNDIHFNFYRIQDAEDASRMFHSKVIHFKGKTNYLLVGSPNITQSALLSNAREGNIELAILFNGKKTEAVLTQFSRERIPDPSVIESAPNVFTRPDSKSQLHIYSIQFNDISRKLDIITESITEEVNINVKIEDGDPIETYADLQDGKITIQLSGRHIPIEVEITSSNKTALRRIYYDRGDFLRNIPRQNISIKEISDRLSKDFSLGTHDIYSLLIGLGKRNQEYTNISPPNTATGQPSGKIEKKKSPQFPKPSKLSHSGDIRYSIRMIERLNHQLHYNQNQENIIDNLNPDEAEIDDHSNMHSSPKIEKAENEKILNKFINTINNVTLQALDQSGDDISPDDLLHTESTFLTILFKLASKHMEPDHLEKAYSIVDGNLESLKKENVSDEASRVLFKNILSWNYAKNTYKKPQNFNNLMNYSDLLSKETYFEIKEFVQNNNVNPSNQMFDLNNFQDRCSSLFAYSLNMKNVTHGTRDLIQAMKNEKNDEVLAYYGNILIKLKSGWENKSGPLFSPDYLREVVNKSFDPKSSFCPEAQKYIVDFLKFS